MVCELVDQKNVQFLYKPHIMVRLKCAKEHLYKLDTYWEYIFKFDYQKYRCVYT